MWRVMVGCGGMRYAILLAHEYQIYEEMSMEKINSGKKLLAAIEEYIEDCRSKSETKKPIFANVAGFYKFSTP